MTTLILVDVQKDFHPGGSLAIPTADEDSKRIATLIRENATKIHRIVATMDTHQKLHIAHPSFWIRNSNDSEENGTHPNPFTIISVQDLERGLWKPRSDLVLPPNQLDTTVFENAASVMKEDDNTIDLNKYCMEYTRRLEEKGRFQLCIWPEHCLLGSVGHSMVDVVQEAVNEWTEVTGRTIEWVHKGQNLLTEMYSAIAADVPVTLDTAQNTNLLKSLKDTEKLLVCGQAMSHCVNYTLRDIVDYWPEDQRSQIYLLTDCASAVPGFEAAAEIFQSDMQQAGVQLVQSTQVFATK